MPLYMAFAVIALLLSTQPAGQSQDLEALLQRATQYVVGFEQELSRAERRDLPPGHADDWHAERSRRELDGRHSRRRDHPIRDDFESPTDVPEDTIYSDALAKSVVRHP